MLFLEFLRGLLLTSGHLAVYSPILARMESKSRKRWLDYRKAKREEKARGKKIPVGAESTPSRPIG
jgi:hypothetical protein